MNPDLSVDERLVNIGSESVQPRARVRRNTGLPAAGQIKVVLRRGGAAAEATRHLIGRIGVLVELLLVIVRKRDLPARVELGQQPRIR